MRFCYNSDNMLHMWNILQCFVYFSKALKCKCQIGRVLHRNYIIIGYFAFHFQKAVVIQVASMLPLLPAQQVRVAFVFTSMKLFYENEDDSVNAAGGKQWPNLITTQMLKP